MSGLEERYHVNKINDETGKHDECFYFVLDPKHDPHSWVALLAYAESVKEDEPELATELEVIARYWSERKGE
jgi:hypothetical protein